MEDHGLALAVAKTEIILLMKKRISLVMKLYVGDAAVTTETSMRYLGVTLDSRLTLGGHIKRVANKAARVTMALSRIMVNTVGLKSCKRCLLIVTAKSVMFYGAEVWADAMNTDMHRKRIMTVQRRGALRITSSYPTLSGSAVLMITGVILIDLLALGRKFVYRNRISLGKAKALEVARVATMRTWCERWDTTPVDDGLLN